MRLDELLEGIEFLDINNLFGDMEVSSVTCDSRQVQPGAVFVAIKGEQVDGHDFIQEVLNRGVTAVVQGRPLVPGAVGSFIRVANPRNCYALLTARLAGHPSRRVRVIGVTGTNGKTSTVLITRHLLEQAGWRPAALGTLGLLLPGAIEFSDRGLTTPDAGKLQARLAELAEQGVSHLIMEVSSHALHQERVAGIEFAGAAFTNLTQDHFDYHATYEDYLQSKLLLFNRHLVESGGYAVVNLDDPAGPVFASQAPGVCVKYGSQLKANLVLQEVSNSLDGLAWEVVIKNGVWPSAVVGGVNHARFSSRLAGRYNAYNCSAAAAIALLEGLSLEQIAAGLATFPGVPGRLQRIENTFGISVFVDYAHTPDALNNVLTALGEIRQGRIITVFGCGGDRDRQKRPLMGAAAQAQSDIAVVTSDNPRSEDPETIINEILTGMNHRLGNLHRVSDRRQAIRTAIELAQPGDIVLIAGKGHEDYQILADRTIHFSDAEEAEVCLAAKTK